MKKRRFLAIGLAAAMTCAGILTAYGDELEDLQAQQAEAERALEEINSAINDLEGQKTELLGQIDSVNQELVITMAAIDALNHEIVDKEAQLAYTETQLEAAEEREAVEYAAMKKRIQYLYEKGGNAGWATILLEDTDITELLNQTEYTQKMYEYDRSCLESYVEAKNAVAALKAEQENERVELLAMKGEQEEQQAYLTQLLESLNLTSAEYSAQIAAAEASASDYQALIEAQNAEIQRLQEERRQAEIAAAAARAAEEAAARRANEEQIARAAAEAAAAAQQQQTGGGGAVADGGQSSEPVYYEPEPGDNYSEEGQAIVNFALQFVGYPYVYGGNSLTNGTDCSGFTKLVYAHFGYSIPRSSAAQRGAGRPVSYSEMQPGDLICYSGHVAMYIGNGMIVHASNETVGIIIGYNPAYRPILTIRRIIP